MATQGLLSIVDKANKVKFKIVCGCNGSNIKALAESVKKLFNDEKPITATRLYIMADDHACGCKDCLAVLSDTEVIYHGDGDDLEISESYRKTFNRPKFNPRWEVGTAEYTEVIKDKRE
jgi:hypothetical protein